MVNARQRIVVFMLLILGVLVSVSVSSPVLAEPQPPVADMSPEGLDLGFGDGGNVGVGDHGGFVVSDGSGGVLVVASPFTFGGPSPSLFSRRLDADGVLDESRGIVEVLIEGRGLVEVLGDGAGAFYTLENELIGSESAVVVAKYNSSGQPDTAYGDGGSVRFQFMPTNEEMESYINGSFTFIMRNQASDFAVTPSG